VDTQYQDVGQEKALVDKGYVAQFFFSMRGDQVEEVRTKF
jgi:hypothetical protein